MFGLQTKLFYNIQSNFWYCWSFTCKINWFR